MNPSHTYTQPIDHLQPGIDAARSLHANGHLRTGQDLENAALGFLTYLASLAPNDATRPIVVRSKPGLAEDVAFLRSIGSLLTIQANSWQQISRMQAEKDAARIPTA